MALTVPGSAQVITYTYSRGDLYDTLTVNNIKFALFHKALTSTAECRNVEITTKDCNCVFLNSIEAEGDIIITAVNVLSLGTFSTKKGKTLIEAENFYGIGTLVQGDIFSVHTSQNTLTLGLHGNIETIRVKSEEASALVHIGMDARVQEILTEIKALFSQGIQESNSLQLAQGLLKAAVALNDQHKVVMPSLTFPSSQVQLEDKSS